MKTRLLTFSFLLLILQLTGEEIFAQQKADTSLAHKNEEIIKKEDTTISSKDTGIVEKNDTLILKSKPAKSSEKSVLGLDTATRKKFNPKAATIRSLILPGWGQFYNKKYWKIPIIYGALGVTAYVFFYNLNTYRDLRDAVIYRSSGLAADSARVAPNLRYLTNQDLILNRNIFRQNIDYSVLVFLGFWALNVVDATVDAHLKGFDVSPDITMKIRPGLTSPNTAGVSLVFSFKEKSSKKLLPLP